MVLTVHRQRVPWFFTREKMAIEDQSRFIWMSQVRAR
jgi:hypothetical protein